MRRSFPLHIERDVPATTAIHFPSGEYVTPRTTIAEFEESGLAMEENLSSEIRLTSEAAASWMVNELVAKAAKTANLRSISTILVAGS